LHGAPSRHEKAACPYFLSSERLGRLHGEPFDLDFSDRHVFLPLIEVNHANVR
jgi:hypothetical protein